jgi:O-antigen/teichoic acid export membrane protein
MLVRRRTGLAGVTTGSGVIFTILFLFLLVPTLGILGAAIATLLTHTAVLILKYLASQRVYKIPYELGRVLRTLFAATAVIAVNFLLHPNGFWVSIAFATMLMMVFIILIPVLSLLAPSEIRLAYEGLRKLTARTSAADGDAL